ncbi:hypothetical protein [Acidianus brierleyi]|uniref:hypothetical protein n=1 Tax=Acidianus brierleyi TaxID=41673 RepID=UPI0013A52F97|nr:hypothetical protein [Acidianus brierleyi]
MAILKVSEDVKEELMKLADELPTKKGKKESINNIIEFLIEFYKENSKNSVIK